MKIKLISNVLVVVGLSVLINPVFAANSASKTTGKTIMYGFSVYNTTTGVVIKPQATVTVTDLTRGSYGCNPSQTYINAGGYQKFGCTSGSIDLIQIQAAFPPGTCGTDAETYPANQLAGADCTVKCDQHWNTVVNCG